MLWTWLPPTMRIRDPHLEFTSSEHGCSLKYMLSKIESFEFTLFIIRSTEDRVCGSRANGGRGEKGQAGRKWGRGKRAFVGILTLS
jgi:hypothetical protein